jgi:plastocyanin domain-containing protein
MTKFFSFANTACLFFILALSLTAASAQQKPKPPVQKQTIILRDGAYQPASFRLKRGVPAQITVIRKSADECGEVIVFPAYNIRRYLKLNRPVVIRFTPRKTGTFSFMCGMDMMYGKVIVQ